MRMAAIAINAVIFLVTLALLISYFRKDGKWNLEWGLGAFRFFTVQSNVLSAVASLVMAVCWLRGGAPEAAVIFKYLGACAVAVTMLTVLCFLGPTQGYRKMLHGDNFYMHLVGPLLAIGSFCFMEKGRMAFSTALLGLIPVALYGALYLYKVLLAPEGRRWEDFYGFNAKGRWPVSLCMMLLGTFVACVLLWLL